MIGLLTLQAALLAGAGRVFVFDVDDTRLELACSLGATGTFNSNNRNPIPEIQQLTSDRGADVALECVGIPATVDLPSMPYAKAAWSRWLAMSHRQGGNRSPVGCDSPDSLARILRVFRRISGVHFAHLAGSDPRRADFFPPWLRSMRETQWFRRLYAHEPGLLKVVLQP